MKTLVTGAGGFLGLAISRMLVERGDEVRGFSRGFYGELEKLGVEQQRGNLKDRKAVRRATEGMDLVFHVAARAGAWGPYDEYHDANVLGTRNVLEACRLHGVRSLVFTSTPSVVSSPDDVEGGDESLPYATHHLAYYPMTKAEAERMVKTANGESLRTVTLRPHLVWGPRDPHLLPRLIARRKAGKLRRVSGEPKLVDTTYIDDAARAHLLAADRLCGEKSTADKIAGKAYFISSGKPIALWEMVDRLLAAAGLPAVDRSISPRMAHFAGAVLERVYSLLRLRQEPAMTRWVAQELCTAHWFDISAARRDLGYEPQVSLEQGMDELTRWLQESGGSDA